MNLADKRRGESLIGRNVPPFLRLLLLGASAPHEQRDYSQASTSDATDTKS